MNPPDINSPCRWKPPLPWVLKTAAMSCLPSAAHGGVSLPDPLCKIPLSNRSLMSLSLSLGSFFSLEAGQLQGLQTCRVQSKNWWTSQEAEETPMSAEMLGNKDREWKVVGVIPRWLSSSLWGPVAAVYCERCLPLPLYRWYSINLRDSPVPK